MMAETVDVSSKAAAMAALAICESLLLALCDLKVVAAKDAADLLKDAAAAYRRAEGTPEYVRLHHEVASIIENMTPSIAAAPRPGSLP
jgi:hypothetical protein